MRPEAPGGEPPRPGEDFSSRSIEGLKDVRGPRRPVGYRPGFQLEERLGGLLLALVGVAGCVIGVTLLNGAPRGAVAVGISSPLTCLMTLGVAGAVVLVGIGLWRMVDP